VSDIVEHLAATIHPIRLGPQDNDASVARWFVEAAIDEIESLRTQLAEEIRISNERGQHIEQLEALLHAEKYLLAGLAQELATATRKLEEARKVQGQLVNALNLALEYWRHRQQRYKNRHPAWVEAANEAIDQAIEQGKGGDDA
jgi:DNA repair exonuclease SbcCD ATPase subunit